MRRVFLGLLVYGIIGTTRMIGQQPPDQSADEAAIRKAAASYIESFNKHDAKALADLWSPDAVYLNRTTGEELHCEPIPEFLMQLIRDGGLVPHLEKRLRTTS